MTGPVTSIRQIGVIGTSKPGEVAVPHGPYAYAYAIEDASGPGVRIMLGTGQPPLDLCEKEADRLAGVLADWVAQVRARRGSAPGHG